MASFTLAGSLHAPIRQKSRAKMLVSPAQVCSTVFTEGGAWAGGGAGTAAAAACRWCFGRSRCRCLGFFGGQNARFLRALALGDAGRTRPALRCHPLGLFACFSRPHLIHRLAQLGHRWRRVSIGLTGLRSEGWHQRQPVAQTCVVLAGATPVSGACGTAGATAETGGVAGVTLKAPDHQATAKASASSPTDPRTPGAPRPLRAGTRCLGATGRGMPFDAGSTTARDLRRRPKAAPQARQLSDRRGLGASHAGQGRVDFFWPAPPFVGSSPGSSATVSSSSTTVTATKGNVHPRQYRALSRFSAPHCSQTTMLFHPLPYS